MMETSRRLPSIQNLLIPESEEVPSNPGDDQQRIPPYPSQNCTYRQSFEDTNHRPGISLQSSQPLSRGLKRKPSLGNLRWDSGHSPYNAEVAFPRHPAPCTLDSVGPPPCKARKYSDASSGLRTTLESRSLVGSPYLATQGKKKAAQDAHAIMERQRRQEIGELIRELACFMEISGTKVEILTKAVEWIEWAKSRIEELLELLETVRKPPQAVQLLSDECNYTSYHSGKAAR
ncbi:MAG: hypothetical protein Q9183_000232 [Haloplaca sp. 2 TL-2023]